VQGPPNDFDSDRATRRLLLLGVVSKFDGPLHLLIFQEKRKKKETVIISL